MTEPEATYALIYTSLISATVALLAMILGVFALISQQKYKRRYKITRLNDLSQASFYIDSVHRILKKRTGISEMLFNVAYGIDIASAGDTQREIRVFISICIDECRYVFSSMSQAECAVCIKMIDNSNDTAHTYTLARDSAADNNRRKYDSALKKFPVAKNTAFNKILFEGYLYFFSNDLQSIPGYTNTTDEWKTFYNTTCVVPIYYVSANKEDGPIIGFLCVDSKTGKFDEYLASSYLATVATTISYAIGHLGDLNQLTDTIQQRRDNKPQSPSAPPT